MTEAEHDEETLKRNLKNVHEDRVLAEAQLPRRGPCPPTSRDLVIDPDDTLLKGYWDILQRLRQKGWQLDLAALEEADKGHRYCAIPSPARRSSSTAGEHRSPSSAGPPGSRFPPT